MQLINNRREIAEDLHHHVIHRLSRLGMDLHGIAARSHDNAIKTAIVAKIDNTDEIIQELRAAIFALRPIAGPDAQSAA